MFVMSSDPPFLGLDLSTQQLKAVITDRHSTVVHQASVHFDTDLPLYGTTGGVLKGPEDGQVTSPVEMWLGAIDLLFERMENADVDLSAVVAVSGACQQHGSVFWTDCAEQLLVGLNPFQSLASQLFPSAFSLHNSPTWQDSSTTAACKHLEDLVGGPRALADLTGSRAYERFTGNQISRISRLYPAIYRATSRISLVSSFVPSLFLGHIAPIEVSDASGMNLMNVISCKWEDKLLEICGGSELRSKLGPEPVAGGTFLGKISPWWVQRWGFNQDCIIASFTGDNPATVISLSAPGDAVLSLGTSTTFLLSISPSSMSPKRFTTSHLLAHPTEPGGHIAMLCYKNGALAREQIRDRFANGSWTEFNKLVEDAPPGCADFLGFYFPLPEIIPPNVKGEFYFTTNSTKADKKLPHPVDDIPPSLHPRAILESQFLSIRSRIAAILPENSPPLQRLVITGGSSANQTIRQLAAVIPQHESVRLDYKRGCCNGRCASCEVCMAKAGK